MQDEIGRAIDEGLSFEQFQADAEKILRYHGGRGRRSPKIPSPAASAR